MLNELKDLLRNLQEDLDRIDWESMEKVINLAERALQNELEKEGLDKTFDEILRQWHSLAGEEKEGES